MGGQVWIQFIAVAATIVWCAVISYIILKLLDAIIGLRVSEEDETAGLDVSQHDERGYIL